MTFEIQQRITGDDLLNHESIEFPASD